MNDQLFFLFRNDKKLEVKLMNKLQFSHFTVLYALPQKKGDALDDLVKRTTISKLKKYFQRLLYENLMGKKEVVILNEESMDTAMYREFNRRVKI